MHKNSTNIMSTNNNNIQIKCNNINSLKSVLHKTRFTIFLIHTNQTCPMVLNGKVGTAFQYIRLYMVPQDNTSALAKIYLHQDHTDNLIIFCWKNIQFENISIESTVFMEDSENKYHNYTFHFFFIL